MQAHAKVWHTYDTQWRGKQKGKQGWKVTFNLQWVFKSWEQFCMSAGLVGISLSGDWGEPVDISNQKDIEAAERYVQFYLGWFATPIFHGDYPQVMKDFVGELRSKKLILPKWLKRCLINTGVQEERVCSRDLGHLDCLRFLHKRRAT